MGPVGPRWAPRWPHEPCYQGYVVWFSAAIRKAVRNVKYHCHQQERILTTCDRLMLTNGLECKNSYVFNTTRDNMKLTLVEQRRTAPLDICI